MSLRLVTGGAGSGKTWYCQQYVIRGSMADPTKHFLYIVPEQFTMSVQRELVLAHPRKGILGIEVLSFARLAWRIFEETGEKTPDVLTETGKNLILRRVAGEHRDELTVFRSRIDQPGYISRVKSILSEFAQYEIGSREMAELIRWSEDRPQLKYKLTDLKLLSEAFDRYREDRFITNEEVLDRLCLRAGDSELLQSSCLVFDSFSGFTPVQLKVLGELLRICPEILVTVTIPEEEPLEGTIEEHELFASGKKQARELLMLAKENGAQILDPVHAGSGRGRHPSGSELKHLERYLFRERTEVYPAGKRDAKEEDTGDAAGPAITLHTSCNPAGEAAFAARTIRRLMDEKQYRCREIAVITGSLPDYENHIRREFAMRDIPFFIDRKVPLSSNPCLEFIRGAIEAEDRNFSYESVMRLLRTGFSTVSADAADLAENYILACGIRGRKSWETPWREVPRTMREEDAAVCEKVRRELMDRMAGFDAVFSRSTAQVADYVDGLRSLFRDFETEQLLSGKADDFRAGHDLGRALQYDQIFPILTELLRECEQLLGTETVKRKEFARILDAGFEEAKVGIIPPGLDQVHVGDMERTRLDRIRVLIFLGTNDGWIPSVSDSGSLMTQMDREFLAATGIALAPDEREKSFLQRFFLYRALTKPSERLMISFSQNQGNGSAMRPSYLVDVLQKLFPGLEAASEDIPRESPLGVYTREDAASCLAARLRLARTEESLSAELLELVSMLRRTDAGDQRVRLLMTAVGYPGDRGKLGAELAQQLYGKNLRTGVTRLERFAGCAYSHFLQYGLRLSEREVYEVRPADLGNIFHQALAMLFTGMSEQGLSFRDPDSSGMEQMLVQCLDRSLEAYGRGVFFDTARSRHTIRRMQRILSRTVWALQRQICKGKFEPVMFEKDFELPASKLRLVGRIDRIDWYEEGNTRWLKVIDYKSGSTSFDLNSLLYGIQLQLAVYLAAAAELERRESPEKEIREGALFYYRMKDPVVDVEPEQYADAARRHENAGPAADTEESISGTGDESILKMLRPDGLLCKEPEVIDALDTNFTGASLVAPMERLRDGGLGARSKAVPENRIRLLDDYVASLLEKLGSSVMEGDISRRPYEQKNRTACDWCSLKEACPQDRRLEGCRWRRLPQFADDAVWKLMRETILTTTDDKEDDNGKSMDHRAEQSN